MRNVIKGVGYFFCISLIVITILDISLTGTKEKEVNSIANNAPYEALKVKLTGEYDLENDEDLIAELVRNVVISKYSNSDIKIQVLGIDAKNGLLDINVIQNIKHANGKVTKKEERRTVIIETEKVKNLLYDLNNDKVVNDADIDIFQKHVTGETVLPEDKLKLLDLNGDGTVDQNDVDIFKQKIEVNDETITKATNE